MFLRRAIEFTYLIPENVQDIKWDLDSDESDLFHTGYKTMSVPLDIEAFEWLAQSVDNVLMLQHNFVKTPSEAV